MHGAQKRIFSFTDLFSYTEKNGFDGLLCLIPDKSTEATLKISVITVILI